MCVCARASGYAGGLEALVRGVCWWVRGFGVRCVLWVRGFGSSGAEVTDGQGYGLSAMVVGN